MFLAKTIENILANIEGDTEIIAVLDGAWANPEIPQNPRVSIIFNPESVGQRAATNQAARLSNAKYLMKCDAHCAFDKGFDVKMIQEMHDDWTMVPLMKNLHAFDWVCPDGHRRYQGPSGPCQECGKETVRDILWQGKKSPNSVSYCFDSSPHFQYFGDYAKRPEGQGEITETMSLQGSCWMLTRDKYWELNVCDETFGGWGSQGIEVAAKTWLSGGRVIVNKKTWYAHMFRTQGGDFGFPYPISGRDQEKAKSTARDLFFNNKWDKQIHPLSWLIEKFWPVKGWSQEDLEKLKTNTFRFSDKVSEVKPVESEPTEDSLVSKIIYSALPEIEPCKEKPFKGEEKPLKGIIFYTDNQLKIKVAHRVQDQLKKISAEKQIPIVSASLKPMPHFGAKNVHLPLKRGYLTMFKQILAALEASTAKIIFFCEHDVLYHPTHFDFNPTDKNTFYYNQNVWFLRTTDGHALHYDVNQLSGLCVYREAALAHFKERVEMTQKAFGELSEVDFGRFIRKMGFEPMTHHRIKWQNTFKIGTWKSALPNIDIRHEKNATGGRWQKSQFRNQKFTKGWIESDDEIPGWGKTADLIKKFN
jgi:glycosyltransferase involved in cell wall biosynthesis